jgi:hypothetical protein
MPQLRGSSLRANLLITELNSTENLVTPPPLFFSFANLKMLKSPPIKEGMSKFSQISEKV